MNWRKLEGIAGHGKKVPKPSSPYDERARQQRTHGAAATIGEKSLDLELDKSRRAHRPDQIGPVICLT